MLLRKSRKHLQGASNRGNLDGTFCNSFYKANSLPKKELIKKYQQTCSTSHLKTRKLHKKQISDMHCTLDDCYEGRGEDTGEAEQKLKKIYQGRRNIIKAVDGWNFDSRGYITRDVFKSKVTEKLGYEPSQEEVTTLLLKYGKNEHAINVKDFISLIHGHTSGSLFNQTLFPFDRPSKQRDIKIDNLKENLKIYSKTQKDEVDYSTINKFLFKINSSISKMKDSSDGKMTNSKERFFDELVKVTDYGEFQKNALRKVENMIDYDELKYNIQTHNSVDHLFLDPLLRKTHITKPHEQKESEEIFVNKMTKTSTGAFKLLRNSEKRFDYDPASMLGINQQKTRFGKQFFPIDSKEPSTLNEGVSPNQKDLILQTIKSQSDIHKQRYENKLQKLRLFKQVQKENIARKEQQAFQKDHRRLDRIRNEQQAYNYVNFIKKKWQ